MNNFGKNLALWVIIGLLMIALFNLFQGTSSREAENRLSYSEFLAQVEAGSVSEVTIQGKNITGVSDGRKFKTYAPDDPGLVARLEKSNVTVKTLLRRLVDKGQLRTKRVGNSFLYRPSRSAVRSLKRAADALLERAAEGTVAPLLAYMVQKSRLSADEVAELRALLDEKGEES